MSTFPTEMPKRRGDILEINGPTAPSVGLRDWLERLAAVNLSDEEEWDSNDKEHDYLAGVISDARLFLTENSFEALEEKPVIPWRDLMTITPCPMCLSEVFYVYCPEWVEYRWDAAAKDWADGSGRGDVETIPNIAASVRCANCEWESTEDWDPSPEQPSFDYVVDDATIQEAIDTQIAEYETAVAEEDEEATA